MDSICITNIIQYPIKSCKGNSLQSCEVTDKGLINDRHWALFDHSGQVITGRQYPDMLDVQLHIGEEYASIFIGNEKKTQFRVHANDSKIFNKKVFSDDVQGVKVKDEINDWFSQYLSTSCTLLYTSKDIKRPVLSKYGGQPNDIMSFADQAPLLMISEASLSLLNNKLNEPISMANFRPNIVISGCGPHDEDTWKNINIGECEFEIIQKCERCIFTTIDPITKKKNPDKEPLITLQSYRKREQGGVDFGVHMVPRKKGTIKVGDELTVSQRA